MWQPMFRIGKGSKLSAPSTPWVLGIGGTWGHLPVGFCDHMLRVLLTPQISGFIIRMVPPHALSARVFDSREHRVLYCPHFGDLRARWDGSVPLAHLPVSAIGFGLWPELDGLRAFQAACDDITFPVVDQLVVDSAVDTFTDGSCLNPKIRALRVAAGSVVVMDGDRVVTLWKGLLGGQQSVFRAELLAGSVALGSFSQVRVISDCLSFVRIATRLLHDFQRDMRPRMPSKHRDLWQYFWRHLIRTRRQFPSSGSLRIVRSLLSRVEMPLRL